MLKIQGKMEMDTKNKEYFKQLLMQLRADILEQRGGMGKDLSSNVKESSGEHSSYSFHLADMGTDTMEREKAFWLASLDSKILYEINYALDKINKNEFGICESCGEQISPLRLEAIPHARLCLTCKSNDEISTI